jgi:hypothetical protein
LNAGIQLFMSLVKGLNVVIPQLVAMLPTPDPRTNQFDDPSKPADDHPWRVFSCWSA